MFSLWIIAVIFIDLHHPFRPPPTPNHYPPQHPLSLWKNCSTLHQYHSDSRVLLNWYMFLISQSNLWWIDFSSDLGITCHGITHGSYIPYLPTYRYFRSLNPRPPPTPTSCTSLISTHPPPLKKFNSQQNSDIKISLKQIRSVPTTMTYFKFKS